nr:hypothetical protein [Candidatus Krumholzibacteria bacterium]
AVRDNGFFVGEYAPAPYAGIWVYTGTGNHSLVVGEIVDVVGIYKEYYDLSEIDVPAAEAYGQALGAGMWTGDLVPLEVSASVYAADPEPYEGCYIKITDGMMVYEASNNYGEWTAESMDAPGMFVTFDDYFFDPIALAVGDCFDGATGCLTYSFGNVKAIYR